MNRTYQKIIGAGLGILLISAILLYRYLNSGNSLPHLNSDQKPIAERESTHVQASPSPEKRTPSAITQSEQPNQTQTQTTVVLPAVTTPTLPQAQAPSPPQAQAESKPQEAKSQKIAQPIPDSCYSLTFSHQKLASHEDGEACLLHKNLISLRASNDSKVGKINPASVCIRVNGKAVKYTRSSENPDQIILGAEAGPHAKITATFCVGKAKCASPCVIAKDEFLSAIGADEESANSDSSQAVGWDGQKGKSKEDLEADQQMAALNSDLGPKGGDDSQIFKGWILEGQTAQCESTPAHSKSIAQAKAE